MNIAFDKTKDPIRVPADEEAQLIAVVGADTVELAQSLGIALADVTIDDGRKMEARLIQEDQRLRRRLGELRVDAGGIARGEETGKERDKVKQQQNSQADHGGAVLAKAPPDQLPLRSGQLALVGFLQRFFVHRARS